MAPNIFDDSAVEVESRLESSFEKANPEKNIGKVKKNGIINLGKNILSSK